MKNEINSWEEVDQALKKLGQLDFEIEQREARLTGIIQKAQERYKPAIEKISQETEALTQAIQEFATKHKTDFDGKQTKILNFGEVSFRLGKPSYEFLKSEEEIADVLLRMGENKCVKIEMKIIKNSLKNIAESTLCRLGVKIVPGFLRWFITPYVEKIVPINEGKS